MAQVVSTAVLPNSLDCEGDPSELGIKKEKLAVTRAGCLSASLFFFWQQRGESVQRCHQCQQVEDIIPLTVLNKMQLQDLQSSVHEMEEVTFYPFPPARKARRLFLYSVTWEECICAKNQDQVGFCTTAPHAVSVLLEPALRTGPLFRRCILEDPEEEDLKVAF